MSAKPFARGYGILIGVMVLWAGWMGVFWIGGILLAFIRGWLDGGGESV